jgi:hypothetical protein
MPSGVLQPEPVSKAFVLRRELMGGTLTWVSDGCCLLSTIRLRVGNGSQASCLARARCWVLRDRTLALFWHAFSVTAEGCAGVVVGQAVACTLQRHIAAAWCWVSWTSGLSA